MCDDPQHLLAQHNATSALDLTNVTATLPSETAMASDIITALPQLLSTFQPLMSNGYLQNSLNFFLFGTVLETGRRLWQFLMDKFTGGFVLTAIFDSSDPAYDWFFAYLNDEKIWSSTREFRVTARTSTRSWGVTSAKEGEEGHAEYSPSFDQPQLFKFKGTICQVTRSKNDQTMNMGHEDNGKLVLTLYTRKRAILDDLVETARTRYLKKSKPRLVVHGTDHCGAWCQTTTIPRTSMDSLILPNGVKETIINDCLTFLRSEQWYHDAGIQHRRNFLLYGPPGCGKTSTVRALAGELDLEIYSLSLGANGLDDSILARLVSNTPSHSIILIEDIDVAFPSREEVKKQKEAKAAGIIMAESQSRITLSGLLNVIDGVSSEEGRLLFATTNYVNRLDPALLRPGRCDVKIHYKKSTRDQIVNLFKRFYPCVTSEGSESGTTGPPSMKDEKTARRISALDLTPPPTPPLNTADVAPDSASTSASTEKKPEKEEESMFSVDKSPIYPPRLAPSVVQELAERFADGVPENTYTVAELQSYLLTVKSQPFEAVDGVGKWMKEFEEEKERMALDEKEREEKEKAEEEEAKKKAEEEKKAVETPMVPIPPSDLLTAALPTSIPPILSTVASKSVMTE